MAGSSAAMPMAPGGKSVYILAVGSPLFILSFRHRDELTRLAEGAGWQAIAARRADNAEARFVASGAAVAVIDARGALDEGLEAARSIADAVEANAASMLVLLSRNDGAALENFYRHGATHFLVSPFAEKHLIHAFIFARRHAERVAGGTRGRSGGEIGESWRWQPGSRTVELSPALARKAGLGEEGERRISLMELFRKLDPEGRRAARGAIERVLSTGEATAFAHGDDEQAGGRIAHHVRHRGTAIVGRAETIRPERGVARDPLTGLGDSGAVRNWLAELIGEGKGPLVVILLSVSRYDAVNAAFGRSVGDLVLQAAARRIELQLDPDRSRFRVGRMAGAEFAVILAPPAKVSDGAFLARELVEGISRPFLSGDQLVTLSSRAGVAASEAGDDAAAVLRRASIALAEARLPDSAPIRVLEEGSESQTARRERLEVDLRRALADGEIEVRFQPQLSTATGQMVGVEALARWNHPSFGELGASTLFGVAEGSDYLPQLSEHVLARALSEARTWPERLHNLRLAVNITAADMLQPGFAEQFAARVAEAGFPPQRLTVEVTESGLIEDLAAAAALLAQLRSVGFRIAIDDFGTGYSSLAYLKALPLDYLKIDKRLSQDIVGSSRDRIVVRGVIDMARSLGLDVVAEGVETKEQLALLAQEGCTLYQGFLCSPPVDSPALIRIAESLAEEKP